MLSEGRLKLQFGQDAGSYAASEGILENHRDCLQELQPTNSQGKTSLHLKRTESGQVLQERRI